MKTSHFFAIVLAAITLGSSILVNDITMTNQMNQASLISFPSENLNNDKADPHNLEKAIILPVKNVDGELYPHLVLPEVQIEGKMDRTHLYPTKKHNGEYIPVIPLKQIDIKQ
ncbi:MAG: hypothetical protein HKN75_04175 [Bacteroidia bacterium]|nr:hypothetical protein [Bacteroidia bacterium]